MPPDDAPDDRTRLDRLEARLDRLERAVDALRAAVEADSSDAASPPDDRAPSPPAPPDAEPTAGPANDDGTAPIRSSIQQYASALGLRSEDWLSYVGIGLLLFGLAFLFRYSIEQGWLVPAVRVGFGAATGSVLLWGGLTRTRGRPRLRQILLGGGVATLYGTIFAAYQLYGLLSYLVAFGSMGVVTLLAIGLALRQDHASTAVIGTLGGLGTPFLLYAEVEGVAGFTLYTCLVLGGACAVYQFRGWRSLLYTTVGAGWLTLLVPCVRAAVSGTRPDDAWVLQAGLVTAWGLLAGTPVLRALRAGPRSPRTSASETGLVARLRSLVGSSPTYGVVVASPLLALLASRLLWTGPDGLWAGAAAAGALLYTGLYGGLRVVPLRRLAAAHGLAAAVLATYGLSEALGGATLLLTWAVEATLLLTLARRLNEPVLRLSGHVLFGLVGGGMGLRLWPPAPDTAAWAAGASLSEVLVLALGGLAARGLEARRGRRLYQGLVLVGWLAWTGHELAPLPNGQAYVSVAWGGTAAALLVGGAWTRHPLAQKTGLAVLALFVGKLFFVDLAALPALGRIALFLGAGVAFLLIGYSLPALNSDASDPGAPPPRS